MQTIAVVVVKRVVVDRLVLDHPRRSARGAGLVIEDHGLAEAARGVFRVMRVATSDGTRWVGDPRRNGNPGPGLRPGRCSEHGPGRAVKTRRRMQFSLS
jgi:hypothetical protein